MNKTYNLNGEEYIELVSLLKILKIAESGGQAKMFVSNGEVLRNGQPESRKRAKLRTGEEIEIFGIKIRIE
ncbi:MAG: RNA-binding S4 domain-containing protein [Bacteroidota bacterium]|nr:RNA-binding S4 domain-containing protein [Bacteroidota bacterium]MDP4206049.1 RNA-binding S4 domain-containing protein [Bacteroidota bacterium]